MGTQGVKYLSSLSCGSGPRQAGHDCRNSCEEESITASTRLIALRLVALVVSCLTLLGADSAEKPIPVDQQTLPAAECSAPVYTFEPVFQGEYVAHLFAIQNVGKSVLRIERVEPSCRCTIPEFDKEIAPGQTGHVHIELSTKDASGRIRRTASVHTNDPKKPTITIALEGEVKKLLRFEPPCPRIEALAGSGPATTEIRILSSSGDSFEISAVKAQSADLKCSVVPIEAGKAFTLRLAVDTSRGPTSREDAVLVVAKAAGRELSSSLGISIRLVKRIHFVGENASVHFFGRETRQWQKRELPSLKKVAVLESVDHRPFEVSRVETRDPWIKASAQKIKNDEKWQIIVEVVTSPEKTNSSIYRSVVTVHTNDPSVPTVELNALATF